MQVPEAALNNLSAGFDKAADLDNEISEDDESFEDDKISCASPLYKAKVGMWTAKYQKYHGMGKARKAEHYQRLLLAHPPTDGSHGLLRGYYDALDEEYVIDADCC